MTLRFAGKLSPLLAAVLTAVLCCLGVVFLLLAFEASLLPAVRIGFAVLWMASCMACGVLWGVAANQRSR